MKGVNQVFAQWFNRRHDRKGHLWGDRFKSVIVEGGRAARVISSYIDLNPVRAGIVEDPKDYRWSGYGQAMAGVDTALRTMRNLRKDTPGSNSQAPRDPIGKKYKFKKLRDRPLFGKVEEAWVGNLGITPREVERVERREVWGRGYR
jgi:hypothetical protein